MLSTLLILNNLELLLLENNSNNETKEDTFLSKYNFISSYLMFV